MDGPEEEPWQCKLGRSNDEEEEDNESMTLWVEIVKKLDRRPRIKTDQRCELCGEIGFSSPSKASCRLSEKINHVAFFFLFLVNYYFLRKRNLDDEYNLQKCKCS